MDGRRTDLVKELLTRRVAEVIEKDHLEAALRSGQKLKVKFGIDPTSSKLHLGHTVPLLKLKEFLDLGHHLILVIGDETAVIGDPTGRRTGRKPLTKEQIKKNMGTYKEQIKKVIGSEKIEFVYNSTWFEKMNIKQMMNLVSKATFNQLLKRREFKDRSVSEEISLAESLYPLMQGYDSVQIKADVEIGGTDQKFNLLMGRQVQKRFDQKEQDIITVPLLIGTDGKDKMSKTAGNTIDLEDSPEEMYAKLMSLPDEIVISYFELCTEVPTAEVGKIKTQLATSPLDVKKKLALEITGMYHGDVLARSAQEEFRNLVQQKKAPTEVKEKVHKSPTIITLESLGPNYASAPTASAFVTAVGGTVSMSEARRVIEQGGIDIDGKKPDPQEVINLDKDHIIRRGKRYIEYKSK